jgi:hypothetical protein
MSIAKKCFLHKTSFFYAFWWKNGIIICNSLICNKLRCIFCKSKCRDFNYATQWAFLRMNNYRCGVANLLIASSPLFLGQVNNCASDYIMHGTCSNWICHCLYFSLLREYGTYFSICVDVTEFII